MKKFKVILKFKAVPVVVTAKSHNDAKKKAIDSFLKTPRLKWLIDNKKVGIIEQD